MPAYRYRALSADGTLTAGERIAASPEALREELARQGWLVDRVAAARAGSWGPGRRPVNRERVLLFNTELIALLRAGLPVPEALATAAERGDAPRLSRILARTLEDVRAGSRLSEAAARHPELFDEVYLSALRIGERSGDLAGALARYQDDLRRRIAVRKKVGQALAYPVFLLVTLVVILGVLFVFVMPRFVALYAEFEAELPLSTRILAAVVERLHLLLPLGIAGAAALVALAAFSQRTEAGRLAWGRLREHLPFYGALHRALLVAHTARTLATLLGAGLPMVEALEVTRAALPNAAYAGRLARVRDRVGEGQSLAQAMGGEDVLPGTGLKLVEAGEASGSLPDLLQEIARYYEEVLEHALGRTMALVEPSLMLLMGVLIGGIIVVMYLPIFQLADVLQ